mgnify:FL=1
MLQEAREWLEKCKSYLNYIATNADGNRIAFVHEEDLQQLIYHIENYMKLLRDDT